MTWRALSIVPYTLVLVDARRPRESWGQGCSGGGDVWETAAGVAAFEVRELPPLVLYRNNGATGDWAGRRRGVHYCEEIESFMRHLPPPGP